jgi:hypothetical protein
VLTAVAVALMGTCVVGHVRGGFAGVDTRALLGVSAFAFALAWLANVVIAARRAKLPMWFTLRWALAMIVGVGVPVLGVVGGVVIAWLHAVDREPTAPGDLPTPPREGGNPRGTGWPLAALYLVAGPFFLMVTLSLTGMSLFELMDRVADTD